MPPQADPVMEIPKKKGQRGRRPRNAGAPKQTKKKRGEEEAENLEEDNGGIGCICDYDDDDGFMIQCERCFTWQHSICVGITKDNVPDQFFCELCEPREVNKEAANRAQRLQRMKIRKQDSRESSPVRAQASTSGGLLSPGASVPVDPTAHLNGLGAELLRKEDKGMNGHNISVDEDNSDSDVELDG